MAPVQPGDVLLVQVRSGSWLSKAAGWSIRFGATLERRPSTWNHVIIATHVDAAGTFWGMEGRPGAFGPVELAPWLADLRTVSNAAQPKTAEQREMVVAGANLLALRKTEYDWVAIGVDAAHAAQVAFGRAAAAFVEPLWGMAGRWGPLVPGHVVCSSAADWLYEHAGLPSPVPDRWCEPADWAAWPDGLWAPTRSGGES